jgi:hypothetical protein
VAHEPGRQTLVVTDPAEAARRRADKARKKREDREHAAYIRSLGLREQVKARIEERSTDIVDRLMELAQHSDPQVSLRAIDALWSRSYGRPVTPVVKAEVVSPLQADLAQLEAMSLEELARLARGEGGGPSAPGGR